MLAGAGGRQISLGNAWLGLVTQPVGEGGDLGGGVETLQQFGGGLEQPVADAIGCGEAT